MPRPNQGPRIKLRTRPNARSVYEVVWYENGKRRAKSTGTSNQREAYHFLEEFLIQTERPTLVHPSHRPVADVLASYGDEQGPETRSPERIGYAFKALLGFWEEKMVGDVSKATCQRYAKQRRLMGVRDGTIRRELGVLKAAINHDHLARRLAEI